MRRTPPLVCPVTTPPAFVRGEMSWWLGRRSEDLQEARILLWAIGVNCEDRCWGIGEVSILC